MRRADALPCKTVIRVTLAGTEEKKSPTGQRQTGLYETAESLMIV
jgi:hypothetical protein